MHLSKRNIWLVVSAVLWLGTRAQVFALSGDLAGLDKNNSTNWGPNSAWMGGNLQNWKELDFIVCRAELSGSPSAPETGRRFPIAAPQHI